MNLVKKVLETIIVIFVGGVATLWFFGTPELEYKSGYRDKYFNIPKAPKELTLVYRGEIIENISFFGFHIFNRTLKDISGVRLYFKMSPKGKDKVPEIISRGLYPPTPLPEVGIAEKETGTENLYAFDIDTLKRTEGNSFYTAHFIFKGTETPEVAVSTLTKDVDIKEYAYWRDSIFPILITLAIMAVVFVPITIIGEWWALRSRNRQLNRLSEALEKSTNPALTSEQRQLVVDMCNKEFELRQSYIYRKMLSILEMKDSNKTTAASPRNDS